MLTKSSGPAGGCGRAEGAFIWGAQGHPNGRLRGRARLDSWTGAAHRWKQTHSLPPLRTSISTITVTRHNSCYDVVLIVTADADTVSFRQINRPGCYIRIGTHWRYSSRMARPMPPRFPPSLASLTQTRPSRRPMGRELAGEPLGCAFGPYLAPDGLEFGGEPRAGHAMIFDAAGGGADRVLQRLAL